MFLVKCVIKDSLTSHRRHRDDELRDDLAVMLFCNIESSPLRRQTIFVQAHKRLVRAMHAKDLRLSCQELAHNLSGAAEIDN